MKRRTKPKNSAGRAKRGDKRATKATHARRATAQAPSDFLDSMIAAGVQALGLIVDPAWHASVKFNLGLILRLGVLVDSFSLPDETEPGPVFHA